MKHPIAETDRFLILEDRMSPGLRAILVVLGLLPLAAPYELLVRVRWEEFLNLPFAFVLAISIGAIAVGGAFIYGAVAGISKVVRFDKEVLVFDYFARAGIFPARRRRYAFGQITHVGTEKHDWGDRPPSHTVKLTLTDGRQIDFGTSWTNQEVGDAVRKIRALIDTGNE